jgi:hypothetical protein
LRFAKFTASGHWVLRRSSRHCSKLNWLGVQLPKCRKTQRKDVRWPHLGLQVVFDRFTTVRFYTGVASFDARREIPSSRLCTVLELAVPEKPLPMKELQAYDKFRYTVRRKDFCLLNILLEKEK